MRLRARGRALVGRDARVALNQLDAAEWNRQLLGNQLSLRRIQAVTELALAGERRDVAVGADRDPRVELIAAGAVESRRELRGRCVIDAQTAHAEADDE